MTEIVTLKQLCVELKIDPREARERLRTAARDAKKHPEIAKAHKPRTSWQWVKGSAGEQEARTIFKTRNSPYYSTTKRAAHQVLPFLSSRSRRIADAAGKFGPKPPFSCTEIYAHLEPQIGHCRQSCSRRKPTSSSSDCRTELAVLTILTT